LPGVLGSPEASVAPPLGKSKTDYETLGIDPRCDCDGRGGAFHNLNVRCAPCGFCKVRIKGMWFNEHEGACGGNTAI
jgi:hypothetical protein